MALSDLFNKQQEQQDWNKFNYQSQADAIKRRRAAADYLLKTGQGLGGQGQFIKSGDFTGFVGGSTPITALAQGLLGYLSAEENKGASDDQKKLDADSIEALRVQLAKLDEQPNTPGAAPAGSAAAMPSQPTVTAQSEASAAYTTPVQPSSLTATALPPVGDVAKPSLAAKALMGDKAAPPSKEPAATAAPAPLTPKQKFEDEYGYLPGEGILDRASRRLLEGGKAMAKFLNLGAPDARGMPTNGSIPSAAPAPMPSQVDPAAPAAPLPGPTPAPAAKPTWASTATQTTAPRFSPSLTTPAAPQISPVAGANAQPAPMPTPMPAAAAAQAPAQPMLATANPAPSMDDRITKLIALSRTGPEGAQIAQAQMNAMFASKNGRYSSTVHADPVNGGFVQVVTDTATGRTQAVPLGAASSGGRGKIIGETTDGQGNRYNRYADGSVSPMSVNGQPLRDPNVVDKQGAAAAEADAAKQMGDALKASLNRLTDIDPKTGKPMIDSTAGLSGAAAQTWTNLTKQPTEASRAQSYVEGLKSQIFAYGMARLKAAGGGAGAANSDAEGKRLEMALGNLDVNKLGTEGFIGRANEIIQEIEDNAQRIDERFGFRVGQAQPQGQALRQPGAAPQPLSYEAFKAGGR